MRVVMSTKSARWYFLVASTLISLLCIFGCANLADNFSTKNPTEKLPIRTLSIRIDDDQREELFTQIEDYSEKHQLEFYLSFYNNKETFYIFMAGEDLVIRALSSATTPELKFRFFEKDPTNLPTQGTVDELFSDLKVFLGEIPSVTIIDEK